jgi:hypothetical protein
MAQPWGSAPKYRKARRAHRRRQDLVAPGLGDVATWPHARAPSRAPVRATRPRKSPLMSRREARGTRLRRNATGSRSSTQMGRPMSSSGGTATSPVRSASWLADSVAGSLWRVQWRALGLAQTRICCGLKRSRWRIGGGPPRSTRLRAEPLKGWHPSARPAVSRAGSERPPRGPPCPSVSAVVGSRQGTLLQPPHRSVRR